MSANIPPVDREEWNSIIIGEINHKFSNFVLQLQIDKAKNDVKNGRMNVADAISKIFTICCKYELAVKKDLTAIFKTW